MSAVETDDRPLLFVHAEARSDDEVRTFYEVPEQIAAEVRAAEAFDGETFASCLLSVCLQREGALAEVKRLQRELKARR
jgi:hypothetical protein